MREIFAAKLHKGMNKGIPKKSLPLDFMGFYALAGLEPDPRLKSVCKQYVASDIGKRRDYVKSLSMGPNTCECYCSDKVNAS